MELGLLRGEPLAQLGGVGDRHLREIREDNVVALLEVRIDLGNQVLFFCSHGRAPQYLLNSVEATFTLGLMLEEIVTDLMNWLPLNVVGLALPTASSTAAAFSRICAVVNERLPTPTPMLAVLSILNSTRPAFTALMPPAISSVTVPAFGFGIRPFGPSTRASVRTCFMASVVAMATSNSSHPSLIFFIRSARPASSAPAAIAFCGSSVKTITRTFLPEPLGSGVVPRTFCSPEVASTPRRNESSTVSSNLAFGNLARISTASFSG